MNQFIRSIISAALLSVLFLQPVQADEATKSPTQVFKNGDDAASFAEGKNKLLHLDRKEYKGYSLMPFGSRDKSYAEALGKAEKANEPLAYISEGVTFLRGEDLPPGSFINGDYQIVTLNSFSLLDLTAENLLSEIQRRAFRVHLLHYAKKAEFKDLTKNYREMIRAGDDRTAFNLNDLTQLIILHEGKNCTDDLIKWSKYHKNPNVRLASYLGLIQFGKTSEVEEILKSEADTSVKDTVQRSLI